MAESAKARPVYRNIHVTQIVSYRLPPAGIVSILHRISGFVLFALLPFAIWMLDTSLSTEISFETFTNVFVAGFAGIPGWFVKLVTLGLIWGYLFHFIAGVRHLWMDATHSVSKAQGHSSALVTLVLSTLLTVLLGAKLFGLY
ncbi:MULTISPECIES: succinate dehydrogenase, cytochrome b556 subunit [unclassified Roseateles]|uniref:succinate dehydrogenase, cytochrome b556 subunit n=1 Tax=unclassified Roseateles TaxID=2626991 RepID=UPI00070181AB|nr:MULTISPECIES: succinate dehydrogenase, cytochrome b556 subunit [unclassified Roseateles]KQW41160.1 succinate dehydrogenase [Pelomonas sp. Root405]KRA67932.1 succinate dehydrogenase [Pelomonas sp. Root662]